MKPRSKRTILTELKDRIAELERREEFRDEWQRLKAACHSLTVRLMTYLAEPTPEHLYAVHQILRDIEGLTGDTSFR